MSRTQQRRSLAMVIITYISCLMLSPCDKGCVEGFTGTRVSSLLYRVGPRQNSNIAMTNDDNDSNKKEEKVLVMKKEESSSFEILASQATDWIVDQLPEEYSNLKPQIKTFIRVVSPSLLWAFISASLYPSMAMSLAEWKEVYTYGVIDVIGNDYSQYVQNVLVTCSLVFSILIGQTYYFMYQQQEKVFYALFLEVTEAKSLLEQVALVCSGRTMYPKLLSYISQYVESDLKKLNILNPAVSLSRRPMDDPLESILYLTSVGVPSNVYDTVRSLRQARSSRLGAMQQKLPEIQLYFLRMLAFLVLFSFPVCGSGSQLIGGDRLLEVQSVYFAIMVFGISVILNVVTELWNPRGGAYNVDGVLGIMVRGLDEELRARMSGEFESTFIGPTGLETSISVYTDDEQPSFSSSSESTKVDKKKTSIWRRFKSP